MNETCDVRMTTSRHKDTHEYVQDSPHIALWALISDFKRQNGSKISSSWIFNIKRGWVKIAKNKMLTCPVSLKRNARVRHTPTRAVTARVNTEAPGVGCGCGSYLCIGSTRRLLFFMVCVYTVYTRNMQNNTTHSTDKRHNARALLLPHNPKKQQKHGIPRSFHTHTHSHQRWR